MSRVKLKEYQDTYAIAMAKYGLQRGIDGSKARHVTTQEFYRNAIARQQNLQDNIGELLRIETEKREAVERAIRQEQITRSELDKTEAALKAAKGELKTERLKNSAAEVGTTIIVATRDESIETLQKKITTMQSDHSRELTAMQARYTVEIANREKRHEKEVSLLKAALLKAVKWFPYFHEMIRMENLCQTVGFDEQQTTTLIKGKPLEYSGKLYFEEHNCKFTVERVTAQITPDPTDKRKLQLNICQMSFIEWCKRQFEKERTEVRQEPRQRPSKGLKL